MIKTELLGDSRETDKFIVTYSRTCTYYYHIIKDSSMQNTLCVFLHVIEMTKCVLVSFNGSELMIHNSRC